jgi:hypothetical protein
MKKFSFLIILIVLIFGAQNIYANLTLEDYKEIRKIIKEEITTVKDDLNKRIDDVNRRIDDLGKQINARIDTQQAFMLTGFVILFTGIFTLIGFVIWDRRTAISPVVKKSKELDEKTDLTLKILKEYSKKEPKLAAILKSFNIL